MITAIRDVRRAHGLTLEDVARRCVPPTTAQTIGRLETGARTVSLAWLDRIAAALEVVAADLVRLPDRVDVPVAAILAASGIEAARHPMIAPPPMPGPGMVAITIEVSIGDYRAGDILWCARLAPEAFGRAVNRDVLVPRPGGRFAFGRLVQRDGARLAILSPGAGSRQQIVADAPWIARAETRIRTL